MGEPENPLPEPGVFTPDMNKYEDWMKKRETDAGFSYKTEKQEEKVNYFPSRDKAFTPYPTVNIITRQMWRAELPESLLHDFMPHDIIMLENDTDTKCCYTREDCSMRLREMQKKHMTELGEWDIKYNFLLGEDGNVYEGRGWTYQSARTLKAITDFPHRLDVAYIGKHDSNKPNLELYCLLKTLLRFGIQQGYISHSFSLVEVKDDLRKDMVRHIDLGENAFLLQRDRWDWDEWARPQTLGQIEPFRDVVFNRTDTRTCGNREDCQALLVEIKTKHIAGGADDIEHNFLIGTTGTIFEGRGWQGTLPQNIDCPKGRCLEIAYIGKYNLKSDVPYPMMSAAMSLIKYGLKQDYILHSYTIKYRTHIDDKN